MRFQSKKKNGFQIFAVTGVNTVSFAIISTSDARNRLLGFAVERFDPVEKQRYYMPGFKVFRSIIPHPNKNTQVSTHDHPIQSFVWDDFTAKAGRKYQYLFHPMRGTPRNLDRSSPFVDIAIEMEPEYTDLEHDVFFNRGVASSQAYCRKFNNQSPKDLEEKSPQLAQEARDWLSRELDDALLQFIRQAKRGDGLLCCFYEFRYRPVADELKAAIDRGVDLKLIVDAKINEKKVRGKIQESFPREENLRMLKAAKIPAGRVIQRQARKNYIQHNKFMVLLKGKKKTPTEVWTGSTNISDGGIHGQTNVGHWVRNPAVASEFQAYWNVLSEDPGGNSNDSKPTVLRKNKELRLKVEELRQVPVSIRDIPKGVTPVFSPRRELEVLDMYFSMAGTATELSCITLAFGINAAFKQQLEKHTPKSCVAFLLLEKEDRPKKKKAGATKNKSKKETKPETFVAINASNNVYKAWGSYLRDPLYHWAKETNAQLLALNQHVSYIHSKFLLMDPLGDDPIVVTGSANFSNPSTNANDENMLIIRGDQRVADIYFTEFNRLFNHYYFRAVTEATTRFGHTSADASLFLAETPGEWLEKYRPGALRRKRIDLYAKMKGFAGTRTSNNTARAGARNRKPR